jgi:hypothetical protein
MMQKQMVKIQVHSKSKVLPKTSLEHGLQFLFSNNYSLISYLNSWNMFSLYIVQGLVKVPLQPFVLICMVHMIVQNYIAS